MALLLPLALRYGFGLGFWPTVAALVLLAIPPIFTNTYTGVRDVPDEAVEAARGMGMRPGQLIRRVEVPVAMPLIITGMRISAVQVVATATLGALVGYRDLGTPIVTGFTSRDKGGLLAGSIAVALLALLIDGAFALAQRWLVPWRRPVGRGRGRDGGARRGAVRRIDDSNPHRERTYPMRRHIKVLAVLAAFALLGAACGDDDDGDESGTDSASAPAEGAQDGEPVVHRRPGLRRVADPGRDLRGRPRQRRLRGRRPGGRRVPRPAVRGVRVRRDQPRARLRRLQRSSTSTSLRARRRATSTRRSASSSRCWRPRASPARRPPRRWTPTRSW